MYGHFSLGAFVDEGDEDEEEKVASKRRKRNDGVNLSGSVFASAEQFQNLIDENVWIAIISILEAEISAGFL